MQKLFVSFVLLSLVLGGFAQNDSLEYKEIDYSRAREYVIADIQVTGVKFLQPNHLITISGLSKGMKIKIPGPEISKAIRKYWKHGLFSDVKIFITKIEGNNAYLEIQLKEQPRLNKLEISGINKTEQGDIEEKINIHRGTQITEDILNTTALIIKRHFREKGFLNTGVDLKLEDDAVNENMVNLFIRVNKSTRVKIEEIEINGNTAFKDKRLRRVLKKTKQRDWNPFKGSKFIEDTYKEDKAKLIEFYNERGYRDAKIVSEELIHLNNKRVKIILTLTEGNPYYIRSISWVGNTKYTTEQLNLVLGIKPGSLYDKTLLNERVSTDEDAITSLYMDNGYLFFNINPVETQVENDSIDLEFRIYEGKQAHLNDIIITGNTKTNEHVVRRELYTRPGELFSRTDIIRSVRELATLGHFNPETISPNPLPNAADGTVDIEYGLEERANDQLELSGGWGGVYGFMGTIGIRFSNFAIRNTFKPQAWRPVPSGDGQTLQIRAQASGKRYTGYNISFVEPWFGGKKPNSFSVSLYYSKRRYTNYGADYNSFDENDPFFRTIGASLGLGRRLKWPDDYFSLYNELSFQQYQLNNFAVGPLYNGNFNMFSFNTVLSRSSQDQMIYPRRGSSLTFSLRLTPPYSLFQGEQNYSAMDVDEKFRNVEFHKWSFKGNWYTAVYEKLVLALHAEWGYLGAYNKELGAPPFEKFEVGGDGLSGYDLTGTDVIGLRGYENGTISPQTYYETTGRQSTDGNIYTRYYMELRYPFSLNPSATIYGLAYIEGGNAWRNWGQFNPLALKRSAGVGLRAFLPMFGLLGVDYGYGFDPSNTAPNEGPHGHEWHFVLGQQF